MTKVVIAEKPSVGRDIARVLGARNSRDGYIEGNGWVITWAIGHLVHLFEPDDYGGLWKERWSLRQLPMVPDHWQLKTDDRTRKQFGIVKRLINDNRTEEVICATDAGREGEHIFRLIYTHAECRKPFKRLWISSLTEEAIAEGFRKLKPGTAFDPLAAAARARAQADWLIGMNLTRAYTVHSGALCTIGRVQTPTLAMIVAREILITQFKKAYYYEIQATLAEGFSAKRIDADNKTRIDVKQEAERLFAKLQPEKEATVTSVTKKKKRHKPPMLYDLISLQKDANKRYGMTAATVLSLAQELYERYKLITYPRTESRHISEDMLPQLPRILEAVDHPKAPEALARLKAGHKLSKSYVDKTKLSDHHGIVPTPRRAPAGLPANLRKIYDLVSTRFVCIFFPDHVVEETTVLMKIGTETFRARGNEVLEPGWKVVDKRKDKKESEEDKTLPPLKKGQVLNIEKIELLEKETSPPKRFTDATLLTAMKNAGREVEDEALAQAVKENGLGTPATRAEIIEKLIRTKLIERQKKVIVPTDKGMALVKLVAEPLKSPELTGAWEQHLKDIEEGKEDAGRYYNGIVDMVRTLIPQVTQTPRGSMTAFNQRRNRQGPTARPTSGKAPSGSSAEPETNRDKKPGTQAKNGTCPRCGQGRVIEGKTAWGCNRFREGCRFRIPKELAGKKLTAKQVADLADKGKTAKIKGFTGKSGDKFEARLVLDANQSVKFEDAQLSKPKAEKKPPTCPRCRIGHLIEGKKGFGCNRYREGCHFVIWKEVAGKKLTKAQVFRLAEKGSTTLIRGFTSPGGKKFNARIKLDSRQEPEFQVVE